MPVGDLPGWTQVFADDFTKSAAVGSFLGTYTNWGAYPDGWKDTSKNGQYTPSKVLSATGGLLNMHLHTENGIHLVCAPYPKVPGASTHNGMLYGRYVARFRSDPVIGYKTAWLLWPDSGVWPHDGEIDFPEGNLNSTIAGFMHRMNGTSGSDQDHFATGQTYTTWHTATIEWLPNKLTFDLDGVSKTFTSRVPSTSMHWVIQTETKLTSTPPPDSAAGNVQLDWVAVYKPTAVLLRAELTTGTTKSAQQSHWWIGVVVGAVAIVVIALVVVLVLIKRKRQDAHENDPSCYSLM